jgi:hypothetical protein
MPCFELGSSEEVELFRRGDNRAALGVSRKLRFFHYV